MLSALLVLQLIHIYKANYQLRKNYMDKYEKKDLNVQPIAVGTLSHDVPSSGSSVSSSAEMAPRLRTEIEPSTSSFKVTRKESPLEERSHKETNSNEMEDDSFQLLENVKSHFMKQDLEIRTLKQLSSTIKQKEMQEIVENLKLTVENQYEEIRQRDTQIIELASQLTETENQLSDLKNELNLFKTKQKKEDSGTSSEIDNLQTHSKSGSVSAASLPSEISPSASYTGDDEEKRKQRERIKQLEAAISKLKDMNIQWQSYNDQRETFVKSIQIDNEKLKLEVKRLNELVGELSSKPRSTAVLEFTPAQQEYLDGVYQKLRSEADKYKEEAEIASAEGKRNLAAERKLREEAERTIEELTMKVVEQTEKINDLFTQTEELKSALVVATRTHEFPSQAEQENTINNLREATRQYELDYAKLSDEFAEAKKEIITLQSQLGRRPGGSSSRVSPGNLMSQSVSGRWYEDIETDIAPVRDFGNLHSMPVGRTTPNSVHNHQPSM